MNVRKKCVQLKFVWSSNPQCWLQYRSIFDGAFFEPSIILESISEIFATFYWNTKSLSRDNIWEGATVLCASHQTWNWTTIWSQSEMSSWRVRRNMIPKKRPKQLGKCHSARPRPDFQKQVGWGTWQHRSFLSKKLRPGRHSSFAIFESAALVLMHWCRRQHSWTEDCESLESPTRSTWHLFRPHI